MWIFCGRFHAPLTAWIIVVIAVLMISRKEASAQDQDFLAQTRPLPVERMMHGCTVANDYLYVIGGSYKNAKVTGDIVKARIQSNGHLDPWTPARPLPQPRLYIGSSTLTLGNIIYILGGSTGVLSRENYNTAVYAKPYENGELSQWFESAPWPGSGLNAPVAISTPGYIHLLGGLDNTDTPTNNVYSIAVLENGHLGEAWERGTPLPHSLWYHHAAVSSGRVYVWGGLEQFANTSATTRVYSAPILANGRIGQWKSESTYLPEAFYASSIAVAGPYLISFSPRRPGSIPTNDVWWATANMEGLSSWRKMASAIPNRIYHASATDYKHGNVYIVGGRTSKEAANSLIPNIFFFKLSREARDSAYQGSAAVASMGETDSLDIEGWERQALASAASAQTASPATSVGSVNPLLSFKTFDEARRSGRAMVYYFHTNRAKTCREQLEKLGTQEFASLAQHTEFALVPVDADPQFAQQMGVWRVPTWVFFNNNGTETKRMTGVLSVDDLQSAIRSQ